MGQSFDNLRKKMSREAQDRSSALATLMAENEPVGYSLPTHRCPTSPGEMIREEFMRPQGLTARVAARQLGVKEAYLWEILGRWWRSVS